MSPLVAILRSELSRSFFNPQFATLAYEGYEPLSNSSVGPHCYVLDLEIRYTEENFCDVLKHLAFTTNKKGINNRQWWYCHNETVQREIVGRNLFVQ